jgi:GNAT superfamily N-acetyltransferase
MPLLIRHLRSGDRAAWDQLYQGYAAFYKVTQTPAMRDTVWDWLMDADHAVQGFAAVNGEDVMLGLAHCRPFARPLSASTGGFLDDLFVAPEARGQRVAEALINAVTAEGHRRGWSVIRWITAEDNASARRVYDRLATQTRWVTYDIKL